MSTASYTEGEYLAAYARLAAEGDAAGCDRLRRMMTTDHAGGPARTFADAGSARGAPLPPEVASGLARDARAAVDWPGTNALRQVRRPTLGGSKTAFRFRDAARRRRVLASFRAEAELADGIGAHQLPDSEPGDVVYLHDPLGKPIADPAHVKQALAVRATAVDRLKDPALDDAQKAFLRQILATPAHVFEVKSLQTTNRNYVQMNPKALAAKRAWAQKYGANFHTVAVDMRRGAKHSGHRLYVLPNTVTATTRLDAMRKAADPQELLRLVSGPKGGPTATGDPPE
jgi:hypothetical protein